MPAKKRNKRGGARMGAGRKPKPASERQSEVISVKLTRDEREALESAAGQTTLSAYVRMLIVRHLARRRK
jgi:hypothetical protein